METWIKLYRKFDEWEWFNISEMVHLFIYLLLNANNIDNEWRGVKIKRGQIVIGRKSLNEKTGISEQTLRTCLKRLENTKEITIKSTNHFSIITVCNYEVYQGCKNGSNQQTNQQLTSDQPTTNQQLTTIKEDKNDKKLKNEEELRRHIQIFKESILIFKDQYSEILLIEFFNYWSEVNKSKTKMRFELEPVFELSKRLITWQRNDNKFKNNGNTGKSNQRVGERTNEYWN